MIKISLIIIKLVASIFILQFALGGMNIGEAIMHISQLPLTIVAAVIVIVCIQFVIASLRQVIIFEMNGERVGGLLSLKAVLVGAFFSQSLISFLGGDAMRIWQFKQDVCTLRVAVQSVLMDRLMGLFGLFVLIAASLPVTLNVLTHPHAQVASILLAVIGLIGIGSFLVLGQVSSFPRCIPFHGAVIELAMVSRSLWSFPGISGRALAQSVLIQLGNVLAVYLIGVGFWLGASFENCLALVPPVLLIAMLPISVAGWGVREGAMVVAFSFVGAPADIALMTSMVFGLAVLVVSLVGGPIWLLGRGGQPATREVPLEQGAASG